MTDDASFRVMSAITTNTVADIVKAQNPPQSEIERVGGLIVGTILVRETMSPSNRVQGIIRGSNATGTIVADSHPDGTTRGLVNLPAHASAIEMGKGATLTMMRTLHGGKLHQGLVSLEHSSDVSQALMTYMLESEQVKSMIDVACVTRDNQVVAAGGYIVQLLPDLTDSQLAIMTERLADFPSMAHLLESGQDAMHVLEELLYGMPFTQLGASPLRFACKCSHMRVVASLATLNREEIGALVADGTPITLSCDFCRKDFIVNPEQLRGMLCES